MVVVSTDPLTPAEHAERARIAYADSYKIGVNHDGEELLWTMLEANYHATMAVYESMGEPVR